jgi:DNA-binding MarR family transcriptional regulator
MSGVGSKEKPVQGAVADSLASWDRPGLTLHRILQLHNLLMTPFNAHLQKRYRISVNEFRTLMTLGRMEPAAAHEIADVTGLSTMTVSRAVSTLESHGWLKVRRNEKNRRSNVLTLSPAGRALFDKMLPVSAQVAAYLFEDMPGAEMDAFARHVDALINRLKRVDEIGRSAFLEATRPPDED